MKKFFLFFVLILCIGSVSALSNTNPFIVYKFDENYNSQVLGYNGVQYSLTPTGVFEINNTNYKNGNGSAFSTVSGRGTTAKGIPEFSGGLNWTISLWANYTECGNNNYIMQIGNSTSYGYGFYSSTSTSLCKIGLRWFDGAGHDFDGYNSSIAFVPSTWINFIFVYNLTHIKIYLNGTAIFVHDVSTFHLVTDAPILAINWPDGGYGTKGFTDEWTAWNTSLTATGCDVIGDKCTGGDVYQLYNDGAGLFYPFSSTAINLINQQPTNNSIFSNSNINLNITLVNNTYSTANISLFVDGVYNDTTFIQNEYCFQEFVNVSSCTGTFSNGTYLNNSDWAYNGVVVNATGLSDGDYDTYSRGTGDGYFYINYTLPDYINIANNTWQTLDDHGYLNISIPEGCINYTTKTLSLLVRSGLATVFNQYFCLRGNSWVFLNNLGTASYFYEEAMYWNMSSNSSNKVVNFNKNFSVGDHNFYFTDNSTTNTSTYYFKVKSGLQPPYFPSLETDETSFFPQAGDFFHINATISSGNNLSMCILEVNDQNQYSPKMCYQEFANVSETCGAKATNVLPYWWTAGSVNPQNMADGDYSTSGLLFDGGMHRYMRINYTTPDFVNVNKSIWTIKTFTNYQNVTIPQDCYENDNKSLYLSLQGIPDTVRVTCTKAQLPLIEIGDVFTPDGPVFDEGMYWNITYPVYRNYTNVTLNTPNYFWEIAYQIPTTVTRNFSSSYKIWCNDSGLNSNETTDQLFTVKDITKPNTTYGANNNIRFDNTSHISGFLSNVTINYTVFDTNLFGYELNVTCDINGTILYTKELDLTVPQATIFNTTNVSRLPLQHCTANLMTADDHTAKTIPNYIVQKNTKNLTYKTPDGSSISIASNDADINSISTKKNFDRYNFDFSYNEKLTTRVYTVTTDGDLYPRDTRYPGHFVSYNSKAKTGMWIDFNTADAYKYNYDIQKINDKTYTVTVSAIITTPVEQLPMQQKGLLKYIGLGTDMNKEELTAYYYGIDDVAFNSIGGINVENITAGFYLAGTINITNLNIYGNTSFANGTVYVQPITASNMSYGVYDYTGTSDMLVNLTNGTYYLTFEHPQYFNQTYLVTVENISQNISYSTYQAQVNFKIINGFINQYLSNYTTRINNTITDRLDLKDSNSTDYLSFYVNASTYDGFINFSSIYINKTNAFTLTHKQNLSITETTGFFVTLNLFDERTVDRLNVSAFDNIYFQLMCPDQTYQTLVTANNFSAAFNCTYEKFRFVMHFTSGLSQSYYRSFIVPYVAGDNIETSIYLLNPLNSPYYANNLVIDDLITQYTNPRLFVTKIIGNSTPQITADFVDAEKKITTYLLADNEYILTLYSDNNAPRVLGTYIASSAGDKTLHLYELSAGPTDAQQTYRNGVWIFQGLQNVSNETFFAARYTDDYNKTLQINLTVRRDSRDGPIIFASTVNANSLYATFNLTPWENHSIYSRITAYDLYGHTDNDKDIRIFKAANTLITNFVASTGDVFGMSEDETHKAINWFFLIFISFLALTATIASADFMGIVLILTVGMLVVLGWIFLPLPALFLIGLGGIVALFSFLKKKDKEVS